MTFWLLAHPTCSLTASCEWTGKKEPFKKSRGLRAQAVGESNPYSDRVNKRRYGESLCHFIAAESNKAAEKSTCLATPSVKQINQPFQSSLDRKKWQSNPRIWCKHHAMTTVLSLTSIPRCVSGVKCKPSKTRTLREGPLFVGQSL